MREKKVELFDNVVDGYITYLANQATVYTLTADGNRNEDCKVATAFAKAVLVGVSQVLGSMKSIEKEEFAVLMRDEELKPLVQFSVRYRKPDSSQDNGSFALGMVFRPSEESLVPNYLEFSDAIVLGKIQNTLIDRDKIEMYPQYLNRLSVFLFTYLEEYLNTKALEDSTVDYDIEIPGYLIISMTYSELSEKSIINFTPYEEMKRLIKSDTMLEIAKED